MFAGPVSNWIGVVQYLIQLRDWLTNSTAYFEWPQWPASQLLHFCRKAMLRLLLLSETMLSSNE